MKTKQTIKNFKYLFILLLVIIIQILIVSCDTKNEKIETTTSTEGIINQEKELDNNIVNMIEEAKQKKDNTTAEDNTNNNADETTEDNTTTKKREKVIVETIEPEIVESEIIEPKAVEKKNKEELVFDKFNIKTKISKKENEECNIIVDVPVYKQGIESERNILNEQLDNEADSTIEELINILDTIEYNESEDYIDYPKNILLKKPTISDRKKEIVITYDVKVYFPMTDRNIPLLIEIIYDKNNKTALHFIRNFKF